VPRSGGCTNEGRPQERENKRQNPSGNRQNGGGFPKSDGVGRNRQQRSRKLLRQPDVQGNSNDKSSTTLTRQRGDIHSRKKKKTVVNARTRPLRSAIGGIKTCELLSLEKAHQIFFIAEWKKGGKANISAEVGQNTLTQ